MSLLSQFTDFMTHPVVLALHCISHHPVVAAVQQMLDRIALMLDSTIDVFNCIQLMDTNHMQDMHLHALFIRPGDPWT